MKKTLIFIVIVVLTLTLPVILGYQVFSHPSGAMRPNIPIGSYIVLKKTEFSEPLLHRGVIVVYDHPERIGERWVGRIIGLPNETISIDEHGTYINEVLISEAYIDQAYQKTTFSLKLKPITLSKNEVFIMGDARDMSLDSRSFGPVSITDLKSNVLHVF